ncbi:MAG: aldo/keto reductase [Rubrivivax sp.]|nr:aldo/keto reductase [Rubrivivax sp.]
MPTLALPDGGAWPALGLGTWRLGEDPAQQATETAALRLAFEIGYRLVDTAEMYGDGGAERVLGLALAQAQRAGLAREALTIVSKAYPQHASVDGLHKACEASLRRLGIDQIDLYLLHWRGGVALQQTIDGFEALQRRGWIRRWGVSNFDVGDLRDLADLPGGAACCANQVYYSLSERGVEHAVLPWQRQRAMPLMAYCPIDQGSLANHPALRAVAGHHGVAPAQVALAWVMSRPGVMAIPKAVRAEHLRQNWAAARLVLDDTDLGHLDRVFPPPLRSQPLAMR